ncbi:MAG: HIT domain-containing protein [Alphaproteobacteria bacterium]|nr:HIT domain-containing protein [Alphaproteobacteria bacterium]
MFMYDKDNVFAKIIRGEIPSKKVVENEYAMSFYDVNPMCKTHVLVVPRGEYENILDFARRASPAEQAGFWDCFVKTADKLGIKAEFNVFANAGLAAPLFNQSVFHFHLHLIAGDKTPACLEIMRSMLCGE